MRRNRWTAVAILLLGTWPATSLGDPTVGRLGDPARLVFDGSPLPASPARLRWALAGDPELQAAAEPDQPLEGYADALHYALAQGLRAAGYPRPDVTVDTGVLRGRVLVKLDAGDRRRCGPVRVDGDTDGLDVPDLIHRLTTPADRGPFDCAVEDGTWTVRQTHAARGDDPDPASTPGQGWADFGHANDADRVSSVTDALAEMGYLSPTVTAKVEDDGTAGVLHVHVRHLGPPATVGRVVVTGAKANLPAAVAELLGLHVGERLDLRQLQGVQQRLWESGRLVRHTVTAQPAEDDSGRARVTVDVAEGSLPPIGRPFTPQQQALLRLRAWVLDRLTDGAELTVQVDASPKGGGMSLAFGRQTGLAGWIDYPLPTRGGGSAHLRCGVSATPGDLAIYLPNQRRRFAVHSDDLRVFLRAGADLAATPEGVTDNPWSVYFGGYAQGGGAGPVVRLDAWYPPAFVVAQADDPRHICAIHDGILVMGPTHGTEGLHLSARADTGELLSADWDAKGAPAATRVGLRRGAVARARAALDAATPGPNVYDPALPAASAASLAVEQMARLAMLYGGADLDHVDRRAAVIAKLASPANLNQFRWPTFMTADDDDGFTPPVAPGDWPSEAGALRNVGLSALACDDQLFARETWAWHLQRSGGLWATGQPVAAASEMAAVNTTGGPIACLAAAELAHAGGWPEADVSFARWGLARLSDAEFDGDVRAVLADGSGMAAVTGRVVDAVRQLSPADVDDLVGGVPPAAAGRVRAAVMFLKLSRGPGNRAAGDLLRQAWGLGLRDAVAAELRRRAG